MVRLCPIAATPYLDCLGIIELDEWKGRILQVLVTSSPATSRIIREMCSSLEALSDVNLKCLYLAVVGDCMTC